MSPPPFIPEEDIAITYIKGSENEDVNDYDDVFVNQSNDSIDNSQIQGIRDEVINEYIDQYPEIAKKYVTEHWLDDQKIDKNDGPVYHASNSSWLLGKKRIDFNQRTGHMIIDGNQFPGTPGLYQLIFHKDPSYNNEDRAMYKHVLSLSEVHKAASGRLKGSNMYKYKEIIRPMFYKQRSHDNISVSWFTKKYDL
ncbi:unnamed protein product [Acanthoscelides obtectus]|uniref:DUF8207 domain-containing protein n=1 Tax=Acanthoscelides obtectus TaxID=200917 RepID=A0A9P0PT00_ACAOB|nr:unnamed protein product [Acanthoscelides obtectus]CAK1655234.1 hypothetical protein AOBTE_LOCUS19093 [Acanthoscelides obtectus]